MNNKITADLVVFSLSADMRKIKDFLRSLTASHTVILLSPHKAFENEKEELYKNTSAIIYFKSFSEFISEEEMISCDIDADVNILELYGNRRFRLKDYYNEIKHLKNVKILENIENSYQINKIFLFSRDLGIDKTAFDCCDRNVTDCTEVGIRIAGLILDVVKKVRKTTKRKLIIRKLLVAENSYYSIGNEKRVLQYLSEHAVDYSNIKYSEYIIMALVHYLGYTRRLNSTLYRYFFRFIAILISRVGYILGSLEKITLLSTIHEYRDEIGLLAQNMDVPYVNIQDGYLPSFYPSRYLRYRPDVTKYYCWDDISTNIFKHHGLECMVWSAFQTLAPSTNEFEVPRKPKRILFLTSGAGDWTALKNRSDEDEALISFVELAKHNPNIEFVYRPHPMWVHPEHQGVSSIKRVEEFINWCNVPNVILSVNIEADASKYASQDNLSLRYNSIDSEIETSDIIFGDHSQALIGALRQNKIIAGVDRTRRASFLAGHQKKGLPILKTYAEMQSFVELCNNDSASVLAMLKENLFSD